MKKETILHHIDKNICTVLGTGGFKDAREKISTIATKFRERIPNVNLIEEEILQLADSRQRYTALYVMCVDQRLIDLDRLEKKCTGSPLKTYKLLLLKERLERCERVIYYNQKYKNIIKSFQN